MTATTLYVGAGNTVTIALTDYLSKDFMVVDQSADQVEVVFRQYPDASRKFAWYAKSRITHVNGEEVGS